MLYYILDLDILHYNYRYITKKTLINILCLFIYSLYIYILDLLDIILLYKTSVKISFYIYIRFIRHILFIYLFIYNFLYLVFMTWAHGAQRDATHRVRLEICCRMHWSRSQTFLLFFVRRCGPQHSQRRKH